MSHPLLSGLGRLDAEIKDLRKSGEGIITVTIRPHRLADKRKVPGVIPRASPVHEEILEHFTQRFGRFVNALRSLPDFQLFRLTPRSGLYVRGFGQAFRV